MNSYASYFVLPLLMTSLKSYAHHDIPNEVDLDNPIAITGRVIGVEWINPHVVFFIDTEPNNAGIKKTWAVQADTPNALLGRGINRNSFPPTSLVSLIVYTSEGNNCVNCTAFGLNITDSFSRTHLLSHQLQNASSPLKFGQ